MRFKFTCALYFVTQILRVYFVLFVGRVGWGRGDLNEIVYKFNSHFVHENRDLNTVLLAVKGKS